MRECRIIQMHASKKKTLKSPGIEGLQLARECGIQKVLSFDKMSFPI